jgi:PAS domain S-box-containing protein
MQAGRRPKTAIRTPEEHFRLLVESVLDYGIFMLDPQGNVATWNAGAERIKGWTADEIIGRHFSTFYPREAVESGWPQHELSVATREGRFEDEGWRVRKDGSRFWANVVITALFDEEGVLRGFGKVTRDLTQRKRVEELEASERRINEFLAMLGHELRNPLAPIRNAVAIIRHGQLDPAAAERAAGVIERQVGHLARLVDDLLDVSRITSGKIELRKETVDLVASVQAAIEAARPAIDRKKQAFELRHDGKPMPMAGDATRLTQIALNLINNASKYTPPGGHIRVILERIDSQASLRVVDDGIGIAPDLLPRMFDLFVQGERSIDRSEGGLGLGLTLVRRLVALHGGTVSATSQGPGRGSEFEVRLPLAKLGPRPAPEPENAPAPARKRRVLVVDDNEDATDTMSTLISMWGHEVRSAHDGPAALRIAEEFKPHTILLDIGLPNVSGYDVAKQLRALPDMSDVALIAMTGYGQEEDRRRSREAGFTDHLTKPVPPDRLKALLEATPD